MYSGFIVTLISVLWKKKVIQLNFSSSSIFPGDIMEKWGMKTYISFHKVMAWRAYGIYICVCVCVHVQKRMDKAHFYFSFDIIWKKITLLVLIAKELDDD